ATFIVAAVGLGLWMSSDDLERLSAMGGYVSGIVAAVTLFWLAVGQKNQLDELAMQREELSLQRLAAEQQARELHNAARIGIMTQVQALIDDAQDLVRESTLDVQAEAQLATLYMGGMIYWKDINE